MSTQDAGTRQDLIENGVERELLSTQANVNTAQSVSSALQSEVEHDLIVWPREYLETYLDSDSNGAIPLNEVQLQDILEAAFDRDEELSRNAISSLKKATGERETATLTVSIVDDPSDRTAHPVLVKSAAKGRDGEFEYVLRIQNDLDHKMLRDLLEKTAVIAEERVLVQALSTPTATQAYAVQWYAYSKTWDRGTLIDIASKPTVAIGPPLETGKPGILDSLKAFLSRVRYVALRQDALDQSPRPSPEFRHENSEYVAQYEPDGTTVRLHDKRSAEDERVVGLQLDGSSSHTTEKIRIATEKDLEQKMNKDRSSAASAISRLSDSLKTAVSRADLIRQESQPALTDSGVYSGKIVSETPELLVQRISAATEVAHPKSLFDHIPQIGQLVRIAYHNNVATVREIQVRKVEKELVR